MAYSAYERTAGVTAIALLESLQRTHTSSGTFDTSSTPTLAQVESFLTIASADIAVMLQDYGYAQAQTDSGVLASLEQWNVKGAAYMIELSMPSAGWGGEEASSRIAEFRKWREDAKEQIESEGFLRMGGIKEFELSAFITHGGTSISDKQTIEEDSDFEPFAFTTDGFKSAGSNAAQQRPQ